MSRKRVFLVGGGCSLEKGFFGHLRFLKWGCFCWAGTTHRATYLCVRWVRPTRRYSDGCPCPGGCSFDKGAFLQVHLFQRVFGGLTVFPAPIWVFFSAPWPEGAFSAPKRVFSSPRGFFCPPKGVFPAPGGLFLPPKGVFLDPCQITGPRGFSCPPSVPSSPSSPRVPPTPVSDSAPSHPRLGDILDSSRVFLDR